MYRLIEDKTTEGDDQARFFSDRDTFGMGRIPPQALRHNNPIPGAASHLEQITKHPTCSPADLSFRLRKSSTLLVIGASASRKRKRESNAITEVMDCLSVSQEARPQIWGAGKRKPPSFQTRMHLTSYKGIAFMVAEIHKRLSPRSIRVPAPRK